MDDPLFNSSSGGKPLHSKISRETACITPTDEDHPMGHTLQEGRNHLCASVPVIPNADP